MLFKMRFLCCWKCVFEMFDIRFQTIELLCVLLIRIKKNQTRLMRLAPLLSDHTRPVKNNMNISTGNTNMK